MGTAVTVPLALGSLFEILGSIRLEPIVVIIETGQVDVVRTRMKRKKLVKKRDRFSISLISNISSSHGDFHLVLWGPKIIFA